MKKVISLALTLILTLSLSAAVFAGTYEDVNKSENFNVTADYTKPEDAVPTVYYFTISWEQSGTITYTDNVDTYTWNTTGENALEYTKETDSSADWTCTDAKFKITVENKSNGAITATCGAPANGAGITSISGSYDNATLNIDSADKNIVNHETGVQGQAQSLTATYTITDIEGAISTDGAIIATITVSVAAAG